jgi:hypothetical protein
MRYYLLGLMLFVPTLLSGCAAHKSTGRESSVSTWDPPWAELSVRPRGDGSEVQWFRKTTRYFSGGKLVHWTDARSCSAARDAVSRMIALELPKPRTGKVYEIRADGVSYSLTMDADFESGRTGQITVTSPRGTPVGDWADRFLAELEPCWLELRPGDPRRSEEPD